MIHLSLGMFEDVETSRTLKLMHAGSFLKDTERLEAYGVEDGAEISMVLENPGPVVLRTSLEDRDSSGVKQAAVSPALKHPVARIEVSAEVFKERQRAKKSQLFLVLLRGEEVLARHGLWGERGQEEALEVLSLEDDLVLLAQPGSVLRMEYQVGGTLEVQNWVCFLALRRS